MKRKVAYTGRLRGEGAPGEEANESAAVESAEVAAGTDKPGAKGGAIAAHPLNLVAPTGAGTGTDGKGHAGGGHQARGGHAQNKALPARTAKQPNPVATKPVERASKPKGKPGTNKTTMGARNNLGHFLGRVATGTKRPI